MVNGNYVLYGDRPASSESEIIDDHVQTRTAERKNKRKSSRNANELQRTLNMAQLDNETDSVKYEKKIKEPRLLRYVPTTDVEENFVTEKFETYDLKPTEERPRRYTFQKKPKNPTDGSVNYAYSRSSSSCSSPNGNLPTISEHGEQYGTYRVQSLPSPKERSKERQGDALDGFENKLDKYFYKHSFPSKVNYKGSHPDSLYRVPAGSGTGVDKMAKVLRLIRWPVALVAVCVALALFVYFLMPENIEPELDASNGTYWEPVAAGAHNHGSHRPRGPPGPNQQLHTRKPQTNHNPGMKTPEIDFYDAENDKDLDLTSIIDTMTEMTPHRVLPIKPVFPSHITPEVQYGNEKADADKLRTAKALEEGSTVQDESTFKPHITQKPEKPLAVYFKDLIEATTTTTETIIRAETLNEYANYADKQVPKKIEMSAKSRPQAVYKDYQVVKKPLNYKQYLVNEPEIPTEVQEIYGPLKNINVNFTSGHSNLFGISIEAAEKMRSTTQSSLYNTRVSPTLPTWRDGDDSTTKNYPVNVNFEVPQCRSTRLPLCREILPYDLAGSPATIAGVEATALMSQIEYLVASNCSDRVRHFTCALLEPECNPPPYPPKMPCYNLCKAIVDGCDGMIPGELATAFNCKQYSHTNCVAAKTPCFDRELACSDGTCIPRDWICDGTQDCPAGEDESVCSLCDSNEFRCNNGGCILKRWLCDGYADCPGAEDEDEGCERHETSEPGEESAGSAPAPAVRRPNKVPARGRELHRSGENDSSQELLVTSDSSNSFKRNFTRRPSPSRLVPYTRSTTTPVNLQTDKKDFESTRNVESRKQQTIETTLKPQENRDSLEDVNIGDLSFFDELKKTGNGRAEKDSEPPKHTVRQKGNGRAPPPASSRNNPSKLEMSINKLEKVINGAALLKKAQAEEPELDSPETNATSVEKNDDLPLSEPMHIMSSRPPSYRPHAAAGAGGAHPPAGGAHPPAGGAHPPAGGAHPPARASPCPSGELRCVDGRCITLAQLCDGTIDCTDHADEDNCFT